MNNNNLATKPGYDDSKYNKDVNAEVVLTVIDEITESRDGRAAQNKSKAGDKIEDAGEETNEFKLLGKDNKNDVTHTVWMQYQGQGMAPPYNTGPNMSGGPPPGGGGYNMGPGGYNTGPGGYNMGPGGYNMAPGGYGTGPGGYNPGQGGYNTGPGGYNMGSEGGGFEYDPHTRNKFVRLVFTIVFIMLLMTAIFTAIIYMNEGLRAAFQRYNMLICISSALVLLAMSYAMTCSECTRVPPCNFICLFIALIAMSFLCAAITGRYNTQLIVFALIATLVTVFVCIMLACSNFDFTKFYIYIVVIATAFCAIAMIISVAMLVMKIHIPALHLVILIIGTIINVVILTMELQMILGGKTMEISETDYALAAFMLYTSIVDIFLRFVQMAGIIENML